MRKLIIILAILLSTNLNCMKAPAWPQGNKRKHLDFAQNSTRASKRMEYEREKISEQNHDQQFQAIPQSIIPAAKLMGTNLNYMKDSVWPQQGNKRKHLDCVQKSTRASKRMQYECEEMSEQNHNQQARAIPLSIITISKLIQRAAERGELDLKSSLIKQYLSANYCAYEDGLEHLAEIFSAKIRSLRNMPLVTQDKYKSKYQYQVKRFGKLIIADAEFNPNDSIYRRNVMFQEIIFQNFFVELIPLLIFYGIDPKKLKGGIVYASGYSLKYPSKYYRKEFSIVPLVKILADYVPNINFRGHLDKTDDNDTPLQHAAYNKQIENLKLFLSLPTTDINIQNKFGTTPLIEACFGFTKGDDMADHDIDNTVIFRIDLLYKTIILLLENGADKTIKTNDGETALSMIKEYLKKYKKSKEYLAAKESKYHKPIKDYTYYSSTNPYRMTIPDCWAIPFARQIDKQNFDKIDDDFVFLKNASGLKAICKKLKEKP